MRRKRAIPVLVVALFCLGAQVEARPSKDWKNWFGHISGAYDSMSGSAGDVAEDGWSLGGGATYWPQDWGVGLTMELGFHDFDLRRDFVEAAEAKGGRVEIQSTTAGVIWSPHSDGKVGVQLGAGVGIYRLEGRLTEPGFFLGGICHPWLWWCTPALIPGDKILASEKSTDPGWYLSLGLNFEVGLGSELFIELVYHNIHTGTQTEFIPITVGYRW